MKTHDFILGPVDTDSVSFCKKDMSPFTEEEQNQLISEINSYMPDLIKYAHDGYFKTVVVLKAKNYILYDGDKIKLKGSAIKDQKKEPALREMLDKMIAVIIDGKENELVDIYKQYIKEAYNPKDIKRWCAKKTVTKPVMNCADNPEARLNERKIYEAVKNISGLQEGDKVYVYPCIYNKQVEIKTLKNGKIKEKITCTTGLKVFEDWNGDHDSDKLIDRVVATVDIFSTILDSNQFVDYTLVKNKQLLKELLDEKNSG